VALPFLKFEESILPRLNQGQRRGYPKAELMKKRSEVDEELDAYGRAPQSSVPFLIPSLLLPPTVLRQTAKGLGVSRFDMNGAIK
jgi:hypothetical protein